MWATDDGDHVAGRAASPHTIDFAREVGNPHELGDRREDRGTFARARASRRRGGERDETKLI